MRDEPVNAKGQTRSEIICKLKAKYGESYIWPATKKELEPLATFHNTSKDKKPTYFSDRRRLNHEHYARLWKKYEHIKNKKLVIEKIAQETKFKPETVRRNLGEMGLIKRKSKIKYVKVIDAKGNEIIAGAASAVARKVGLSYARVLELSRQDGCDMKGRSYYRF